MPVSSTPRRGRAHAFALALARPLAALGLLSALATAASPPPTPPAGQVPGDPNSSAGDPPRVVVVARAVALERGDWATWQVDYTLRNDGPGALVIPPAELAARVDGSVSNSRVPDHERPVRAAVEASGGAGLVGVADLVTAEDDARRCQERLVLQAWPAAAGESPPPPVALAGAGPVPAAAQPVLTLAPGAALRVRLRLEHVHPLYGPFDALLGVRDVELRLGPAALRDRVPLDRQRRLARAPAAWPPAPPAELRDDRIFVSGPDSLHLDASVPGEQTYRYPDFHGVRPGARFRLSFWYLVAPGSDGECRVRVSQYRDLPRSYRTLPDGEVVERLTTVGRWARVERVLRAEPEATALGVDAGIAGIDVAAGSLWIDDLKLEPLGEIAAAP
jgi:hypothetical protein